MAGFSFSGLLAMAVIDTALQQDFHYSVFYLFLSFLCYMFALNLQGYKYIRWRDHLATALMDSASLCIILSVLSILYSQNFRKWLAHSLAIGAILVWFIDHGLRIKLDYAFLKAKKEVKNVKQRKT